MAEIKTIYKGESISLLFTFPEAYDMARLTSQKVFVGETEFAGVVDGQTVKLQLKSSDTDRMIGTHRVVLWMVDTTIGLRKPYCGDLVVAKTQASGNTVSVSDISDIIIPIAISETAVTVGDIMYNYVIGRSAYQVWLDAGNVGTVEDYLEDIKGDSFLYSDFTPEQLEALKVKGDAFEYDDFTPKQIATLQQPAIDAASSVQGVEQAVEEAEGLRVTAESGRVTAEGLRVTAESNRSGAELLRSGAESDRSGAELLRAGAEDTREMNEYNREDAEALRVQAEIDRQTNTGTAIQNAETATKNASDAAILANTKAGLANDAAALATEVANNPDKVVADYWHKWNTTTNAYENTGIKAKGDPGAVATVEAIATMSATNVPSSKISLITSQTKSDAILQRFYGSVATQHSEVNGYLTQVSNGSVGSNANNKIKRYTVIAGEKIYMVGSTYCESAFSVYGFSGSSSITGAIIQLGTTGTGLISMDAEITVPVGATYIMVTTNVNLSLILARRSVINDATSITPAQISTISTNLEMVRSSQINNVPLTKKSLEDELNILYIGSSWMQDNFALVGRTAFASGLKVNVANWYLGSATYQNMLSHADSSNIQLITHAYSSEFVLYLNNCSIKMALTERNWDIIVLANSALASFDWTMYGQYANDFIRLCKMYAPQATFATYQGWVFQTDMSQSRWDISLEIFKKSVAQSGINVIIPTGMALYSMLTTYLGADTNVMYRGDQTHLSYVFGRYIAACTNFAAIITPVYGVSVLGNTYRGADGAGVGLPASAAITDAQALAAQKFALSACGDMFNFRNMNSEIVP